MGFSFGNAIAAVQDKNVQACLLRLGRSHGSDNQTLSTLVRDAKLTVSYALSSLTLTAGGGLTGGGDLSTDRTFAVGAGFGVTVAADSVAVDQAMVPTWTGIHTYSAQDVHNAGVSLGTSGALNSAVTDTGTNTGFLIKPATAFTAGRFIAQMQDSTGASYFALHPGGPLEVGGNAGASYDAVLAVASTTAKNAGIVFSPLSFTGSGQAFFAVSGLVAGAYFRTISAGASTAYTGGQVGGIFETYSTASTPANVAELWGAWFRGQGSPNANSNSTRTWANTGGFKVFAAVTGKNFGTFTNLYGGYVSNVATTAATTGLVMTNTYGFYVEEQTRGGTINNGIFFANATAGYKAIAIRDQNAWIGSAAAGELTIGGTNSRNTATNQGVFSVAAIARPTNAIAAAAFVTNTSLIANDTATWGGYTVGQVVQALQNYGILT